MGKQVNADNLRQMSPETDKFRAYEREVIGAIEREYETRKEKIEASRVTREKKAKRKRQRAAAANLT